MRHVNKFFSPTPHPCGTALIGHVISGATIPVVSYYISLTVDQGWSVYSHVAFQHALLISAERNTADVLLQKQSPAGFFKQSEH